MLDTKSLSIPNFQNLFFKDRILKILMKTNVKIVNLVVFIVPYNALLYLPDNILLCLALIRPVFCIGAIVKPNWNKVRKKMFFSVSNFPFIIFWNCYSQFSKNRCLFLQYHQYEDCFFLTCLLAQITDL